MSNKPYPSHGEFCWNELMTSDTQKAKTFYSDLLGWTSEDQDMGHMIYTLFKKDGKDVGGMLKIPSTQADIPPHWLNYIAVDDLETTLEKAKKLGAKVKMAITPVSDFGKFAILEDPTGACFALWKSLKACT